VDLAGGPAAAAGLLAVTLPAGGTLGPGAVLAIGAAGGLGLYDDLAGGTHARGLRGHLRALRHGEVTTGLVKLVGLASASLVAAALPRPDGSRQQALDVLVNGALVAGSANLVNLLDLRPGRALKVALLAGTPFAVGQQRPRDLAAGVIGVAAALLPADLGERRMVGDCGANTLGAALGWVVTQSSSRSGRLTALTCVVGLTLASERVSFSQVIADNPVLDAVDRLGRSPA
jgi:UDP-N-acetylmuramyl pentapeptide phosphotransferase/UDP-N-acetylglucosamine-1-phosphate transferase